MITSIWRLASFNDCLLKPYRSHLQLLEDDDGPNAEETNVDPASRVRPNVELQQEFGDDSRSVALAQRPLG